MSRKDVNKAIKICGTPMTHSLFWKKTFEKNEFNNR